MKVCDICRGPSSVVVCELRVEGSDIVIATAEICTDCQKRADKLGLVELILALATAQTARRKAARRALGLTS